MLYISSNGELKTVPLKIIGLRDAGSGSELAKFISACRVAIQKGGSCPPKLLLYFQPALKHFNLNNLDDLFIKISDNDVSKVMQQFQLPIDDSNPNSIEIIFDDPLWKPFFSPKGDLKRN